MSIPASPNAPVTLVGRERELGLLRDHLDAALAQHGNLVLIGGEAGMGKTALAETLCNEATEQGVRVFVGRCYDLTETPPYGPWIELFKQYPSADDVPPPPPAFAERGTVGAVTSQAALYQQVEVFFRETTTRHPVVLFLDDLHWADLASLDLLRFLARSLSPLPLLLVVSYRSDELTRRHPLYRLLPVLVREAHAMRLDLHALDDAAVHAFVWERYRLPDRDANRLVAYLQGRAEGNAFYLGELLRALEEGGALAQTDSRWVLGSVTQATVPPLLRQVIDGRIARLGDISQRLLTVAAVIGHEVPLDVWAAVADADEETLLEAVEQGLEARLLVEGSGDAGVQFAHALIREALYEGLPRVRRRRIHRHIGEVLADEHTPGPDAVAYHFQQADDERALPWLLRAGERAQAAWAWPTAAERFEAALVLMERTGAGAEERGWLLMRLASLLRYADVPRAAAFADEALTAGEQMGERVLIAYARHQRGILACFAGDIARGLPELEAGISVRAAFSDSDRERFAARVAGLAAGDVGEWRVPDVYWLAYVGRLHEARILGEQLLREIAASGAEIPAGDGRFYGLGIAYAAMGLPDEATAMFARAHDAWRRADHHAQMFAALHSEFIWLTLPYRADDRQARWQLAGMIEATLGNLSGIGWSNAQWRVYRLPLLVLEGAWEEAERLALAGRAAERMHIMVRSVALQYLALLAWLRGDSAQAWDAVGERLPVGSATEPGTVVGFDTILALQRVAISLALDAHDLDRANQWLVAYDRWLTWSGAVLGQSEAQALRAEYHRQAGDREKARVYAERALAHATEPRQPLALLTAHRLVGELDTDAGRYEDAEAHLKESLTLADACAAPYERALTLLAMAAWHAATGASETARSLLDDVRAICAPLGAQPALARADALAARLAAVPIPPPAFPAGLSAREVEVLCLVAAGLTNVQVGERLFLSPRTVEQHLRSIFNKTGATSRTAASRFATEHHLV